MGTFEPGAVAFGVWRLFSGFLDSLNRCEMTSSKMNLSGRLYYILRRGRNGRLYLERIKPMPT
jgi:hypothetical protein